MTTTGTTAATTTPAPASAPPTTQLVLPGQAAAPDGPVDLTMMFVVHHAFRRDLAAFAAAAQVTPSHDRVVWTALAARWQLFSTVLHHHHSGEDSGLWPLLLERVDAAGDAEGRLTLEAMTAEHADIDPLLERCAAGFARLAEADDDAARAALAGCLVAAREHLAGHLRHEEGDALRLAQAHLTQADWDRVEHEHFAAQFSVRETLAMVGWLLHDLPDVAVQRLLAGTRARVLHAVWRLGIRRGFARREAVAFRYL